MLDYKLHKENEIDIYNVNTANKKKVGDGGGAGEWLAC